VGSGWACPPCHRGWGASGRAAPHCVTAESCPCCCGKVELFGSLDVDLPVITLCISERLCSAGSLCEVTTSLEGCRSGCPHTGEEEGASLGLCHWGCPVTWGPPSTLESQALFSPGSGLSPPSSRVQPLWLLLCMPGCICPGCLPLSSSSAQVGAPLPITLVSTAVLRRLLLGAGGHWVGVQPVASSGVGSSLSGVVLVPLSFRWRS